MTVSDPFGVVYLALWLSGHHRKLIVWLPTIGRSSAATAEAGRRARDQEEQRLLAAGL